MPYKSFYLNPDGKLQIDLDKEEIRDILFKYPGDSSIMFRMNSNNGKDILIAANDHYRVSATEEMLREIEDITGQQVNCIYGESGGIQSLSET